MPARRREHTNLGANALLDTLPQPAFIIDSNHEITGWNHEMEVLTGVDREAMLGSDETARFFRDDRMRTLADAVVERTDAADEVPDAERPGRDKQANERQLELDNADGETLHVNSIARPIQQASELRGVLQLVQDNTRPSAVRKRWRRSSRRPPPPPRNWTPGISRLALMIPTIANS